MRITKAVLICALFLWIASIFPKEKLPAVKQILKKIPLAEIESFVKIQSENQLRLPAKKTKKNENILVDADISIFFSLNKKEKKIFVKGLLPGGAQKIFRVFTLEDVAPSMKKPDVRSGNDLSLVLNHHLISVDLIGRALESGSIGEIIRVRVLGLTKNFRVRILTKKRGEILF